MKTMKTYIEKEKLSLVCLLAIGGDAWGQDTQIDYSNTREAMVGPGFMINRLGSGVGVLKTYENLDAVTDEDLDNYTTIASTVSADVALGPIFSVKNTKHVYEASEDSPITAGFCIAANSVAGLLSIDVAEFPTIEFYKDGEIVDTKVASQQSGSGLDIGLVKLPTSDLLSMELSAETTEPFDEILLSMAGVKLSVLNTFCVKYAFVGKAKEYPLTNSGIKKINSEMDFDYDLCASMPWTPIRLKDLKETILNDNLDDHLGTGGLAIGEWSHIQIGVDQPFEKGTEVGFKYSSKGLLNLDLLGYSTIKLYDKNGKEVQSETLEASLLGVGVATADGEIKTSIIAQQEFYAARLTIGALVGLDLGEAVGVYYGFIKKKPVIGHHCEINPNLSATLCNGENSYELTSDVPVTWTLVSPNVGDEIDGETIEESDLPKFETVETKVVSESGTIVKVTNLVINNCDYVFEAKAVNCPSANHQCTETVILHKGTNGQTVGTCGTPIINAEGEDKYEVSDKWHESSGSLLSISDMKNPEVIVDSDEDNYATFTAGLGLVKNLGIIGVKTKDGSSFSVKDASGKEKPKRVGFMIEDASTFLSADILQYYQIRLYKDGIRQNDADLDAVVDEANTVGVGLIGADKSLKVRYSIEVPADTDFDEFQLWCTSIVGIDLSKMRIFYGFVEDADENCSDPARTGCAEYVTLDNSPGLKTDIDISSTVGAITTVTDICNLVDDDLETAANIGLGASILSKFDLMVEFGRLVDSRQQLCLALELPTHLLNINLLRNITLTTYRGNIEQERFEDDLNLLGLDVIGYGGKKYRIFRPTYSYDKVKITFGGLAEVSTNLKLYGLFFRSDIDGDGLPDCLDTNPCPGELSDVAVTEDICVGDFVHLTGLCSLDAGEDDDSYDVYLVSPDNSEKRLASLSFDKNNLMIDENFKIEGITPGQNYQLKLKRTKANAEEREYSVEFNVHPREATWKGVSEKPNDWNEWSNWDNGAPWSCTNVIIPTYSDKDNKTLISNYPILKEGDFNPCNYIHFEPHAEVVNTPYLTYNKAWVEIELAPDRYYMVATPIKGIYSGDWFISKEGTKLPDYFTELTEDNYPANRVTPTIYQRLWEHTAQNKLATGGDGPVAIISETKWTAPYNHMATSYEKRSSYDFNALSVWVHPDTPLNPDEKGDGSTYTFRFPKMHTTYFYSDMDGDTLGLSNNLTRKATAGRFIYEDENGEADFPITMTYNNEEYGEGHNVFLAGNPFMAHIRVDKLFDENEHIIAIKVVSEDGNYSSVVQGENSTIVTTGETALQYIPPMQSFFVEVSGMETDENTCSIVYTKDMLTQQPGVSGQLRSSSPSDALYLSASASGQRSSAMLRFSASASDYYHEGEDADILIDDEVPPAVAVFTVADSHALDIQQRASGGDIPIGFVLPKADEVTLRIDVPEEYAGWVLNDLETGKNYALHSGTNELELGRMLTNIGRFSLRGSAPTGNEVISASQPRIYSFREEGGNTLVVRSAEGMMARCEIYTLAGQLSGVASYETNEYRLPVPPGIKIVKVHFTDGITSTIKTY